jgi:hypothetical protein
VARGAEQAMAGEARNDQMRPSLRAPASFTQLSWLGVARSLLANWLSLSTPPGGEMLSHKGAKLCGGHNSPWRPSGGERGLAEAGRET